MAWMVSRNKTDKANLHLQTAELLLIGTIESYDRLDIEEQTCPEDSVESIIRRLVQIRQELLMVIRELK